MDSESIAKLNQAVDAGLNRCAGSPMPFSALRDFLKELEDLGGWTAEEIKTVEEAITRVLTGQ